MLSKSSVDLLFILNKKDFCTLEYLSKKLELSKNSILNYLDELEHYLLKIPNSKVCLLRKSGEGIRLIDDFQEMNTVLLMLSKHYSEYQDIYEDRCIQELLILINENKYLSLQDLADKMYVSKGTIINDLEVVEKMLQVYHVSLSRIQKRGIKLDGDESDVRKLFSDIVNGKVDKAPVQFLSHDNLNSLYSLFNKEFVDRIHSLIMNMINEDMELSNIQISAILVHVMVAIQRIQCGESLKMPKENLQRIVNTKYFMIAKKFTNSIHKMIGISFDEDEIGYIAIHLMCSKQVLQTYDLQKDEYNVIDEKLKEVVNEIVILISECTNNRSLEDRELMDGLLLHLKPAIERMKNDLSMKNPYLYEIKKNYLPAFDIAIKINELLDKEYAIGFDENEIAYIAMHVQAHIERNLHKVSQKKVVAVVCATGIGSSQLVLARLKNYFGKGIEFKTMNTFEIQEKAVQQSFHLILSTIPLNLEQKVVYVDPFLTDNQLKKIASLLNSTPSSTKYEEIRGNSIFQTSHIHIDHDEKTKEEVLAFICDQLRLEEQVQDGFQESVFKREQIASTAYGQFAIPHGDVNLVNKSCIYIYIAKKGIQWNEKTVKVVFLIALNEEKQPEFGQIFNDLYEVVNDKEKMKKLVHFDSKLDIQKLMLGEI